MAGQRKFVADSEPTDLIDIKAKNKFRWAWMSLKDCNNDFLSTYIRKVAIDGVAWCCYCNTEIKYGAGGVRCLQDHAKSKRHDRCRSILKTNQSLPAAMQATKEKVAGSSVSLPYGAAPNLDCLGVPRETLSLSAPADPKPISIKDRCTHQEALICSFMAEHTLPMSLTPHLINLAKELSSDNKALSQLHMERQTGTYKLRYGLSHLEHIRLCHDMKNTPFSLNIDESTSKASKKRILNILVSFFSDSLKKSVCHLYASIEMTIVNATTVFEAVREQFSKDEIPLSNLISVLSDSAAYMRGCHSGFFKKIQEIAPHIVDIDGDVCHHIHNAVGKFRQILDNNDVLVRLLDDLGNDFDFSSDLREDLKEICGFIGIPEYVPIKRAGHRWMSIYDASQRFLQLKDALILFYSSWLTVEERKKYQSDLTEILTTVNKEGKHRIIVILQRLKSKKLTHAGKERKRRIACKLFHARSLTLLLSNVIVSVMPLFKSFILIFEQKEPLVHRLHDELVLVFKSFLCCFLKHEYVNSFNNISRVDVKSESTHANKDVFIGDAAQKILKEKMSRDERNVFRTRVLSAFVETAEYLKVKLPITNKTLRLLSTIDPDLSGHSRASSGLQELFDCFPTLTRGLAKDVFSTTSSTLHSDTKFLSTIQEKRLDRWWAVVLSNPNYSILGPVIKACLSIFTGPRVESSFSVMNNIITATSNRLDVGTYEAIHKIKYKLLNCEKSSVELYHRPDPVMSPVDHSLCYHMQTAGKRMKSLHMPRKKRIPKLASSTIHKASQQATELIEAIPSSSRKRKSPSDDLVPPLKRQHKSQ